MGNPYLALHVDILHQSDLGFFKTLVSIICDIAMENPRQHVLKEMDRRLFTIKNKSRFSNFRVPGNEKSKYFSDQANFAAYEHRAVMQVSFFAKFYYYYII
jgi:hypothetical protein